MPETPLLILLVELNRSANHYPYNHLEEWRVPEDMGENKSAL